MQIDRIWLGIALFLLLPPAWLSLELKRTLSSLRRSESVGLRGMAQCWQNWLDLIRAGIGTGVLLNMAVWTDKLASESGAKVFVLQFGVLAVGLLAQMIRRNPIATRPEQRWLVVVPAFYLSGVSLVLSGTSNGIFGVAAGWLFAMACKNPHYFLPTTWIALAAAGYVFGRSLPLYGNLVLLFLPFAAAFVARKKPVFIGRIVRFSQSLPAGEAEKSKQVPAV